MRKILFVSILTALIHTNCTSPKTSSNKPSLKAFAKSMKSKEEISFFENNKIIDHTETFVTFKAVGGGSSKSGIRFRWSGYEPGNGGCNAPLGICLFFRTTADSLSNATVSVFNKKLIIQPVSDDNGLTSDGYLPIFPDISLDPQTIRELKLSGSVVKAGIYTANYDATAKKYVAIVVDLQ